MTTPLASKRMASEETLHREGSPAKRFASSCEEKVATEQVYAPMMADELSTDLPTPNGSTTSHVTLVPMISMSSAEQQRLLLQMEAVTNGAVAAPVSISPADIFRSPHPHSPAPAGDVASSEDYEEDELLGLVMSERRLPDSCSAADLSPVTGYDIGHDASDEEFSHDTKPASSLSNIYGPLPDDSSDDDASYDEELESGDPFAQLLHEIAAATSLRDSVQLATPPPVEPYTDEEREVLLQEAREIGLVNFLEKYADEQQAPLYKLIGLFEQRLTAQSAQLSTLPTQQQRNLLIHVIQRFLRNRRKLPNVNTIDDVVDLMHKAKNILVLTGAGVSVSCGIPDFRSANGIYSRMDKYPLDDPQQMFEIEYFRDCPEMFYSFVKEIYPSNFQPSPSHTFIRLLEEQGRLLRNYTQNIDTLEQSAGIVRVLQCHGSFATASCIRCGLQVPGETIRHDIFAERVPQCPECAKRQAEAAEERRATGNTNSGRGEYDDNDDDDDDEDDEPAGIMKPDIVFFGEKLPATFDDALFADREQVDLLIVMGTSLKVAPVSSIMGHIPHSVPQVVINKTPIKHMEFDVQLLGDSDVVVPELCRRLGWRLLHDKLPGGSSDGQPGDEPFQFIAPNLHLFRGAVLETDSDSDSEDEPNEQEALSEEEEEEEGDDASVPGGQTDLDPDHDDSVTVAGQSTLASTAATLDSDSPQQTAPLCLPAQLSTNVTE